MRFLKSVGLAWILSISVWAQELSGSANPAEGPPPLKVKLTCSSPGAQGRLTYRWRLGDGSESNLATLTHTYQRIGNFHPAVEVSDGKSQASWRGTVRVVLKTAVTVAAGGGAAQVPFKAAAGQKLRIRLEADPTLEPYGHLEWASGSQYAPANEASSQGVNVWDGTAPVAGDYQLTVFDGANAGGTVRVTVEEP